MLGEDVIVGSTLDSKTILGQNLTDMTFGEILKRQRFLMDPSNPQESDYGVFALVQDNLHQTLLRVQCYDQDDDI